MTSKLDDLFGLNVKSFYNPTSGVWVSDLTRAGYQLALKPNDLVTAKLLAEHLKRILNELVPNGRILHLAHSGGAILTYLAAKHHLTSAEKERIDVATFGGGRSITKKYFKGSLTNYYSQNDPLLLVDGRANRLAKMSPPLTTSHYVVKDRKHNTVFVFLPGLTNNPINDHSMEGPTYYMALQLEIEAFQQRILQLIKIDERERDIIRLSRKKIANITGYHHFWDYSYSNITEAIRTIRKQSSKITKLRGVFSGKFRNTKAIISTDIDDEINIKNITSNIYNNDNITTNSITIFNESFGLNNTNDNTKFSYESFKNWISVAREKVSIKTFFISNATSSMSFNSSITIMKNATKIWIDNMRTKLFKKLENKVINETQLLDMFKNGNNDTTDSSSQFVDDIVLHTIDVDEVPDNDINSTQIDIKPHSINNILDEQTDISSDDDNDNNSSKIIINYTNEDTTTTIDYNNE